MSEELKAMEYTISYSRTKNLGNYNSEKLEITAPVFLSPMMDRAEALAEVAVIGQAIKADILEALDLPYEIDTDGMVQESRPEPVSMTEPKALTPERARDVFEELSPDEGQPVFGTGGGERGPAGVDNAPPFDPETRDKEKKAVNKSWAVARFSTHPEEFYDNRPKKASGEYKDNAPDLKHKSTKMPVWL